MDNHQHMMQILEDTASKLFDAKVARIVELGLENPLKGTALENIKIRNLDDIDEMITSQRRIVRSYNQLAKFDDKYGTEEQARKARETSKQASQMVKALKYYWDIH